MIIVPEWLPDFEMGPPNDILGWWVLRTPRDEEIRVFSYDRMADVPARTLACRLAVSREVTES